jgi:alcohol dehydrogenase (cytochrome c)
VALDAETGNQVWNVEVEDAVQCHCGITSPPLFVKGKVISGVGGGGYGHMRGYLNAFDARTGERVWHLDTVVLPTDTARENSRSSEVGGSSTWFTGTYDPELNLIYWGTGDPSPTFEGKDRPGPNLYSASLIAVDADTGKMKWYFQETPHDLYDYDSQGTPMLVDFEMAGRSRKVVIHTSKNGFAYVLDRQTGQFLKAFPFGVTPTWTNSLDAAGKPLNMVDPKQVKDAVICPAIGAGAQGINHFAYSPRTGLWYATDYALCTYINDGRRHSAIDAKSAPNITAFDPATGKEQWTFKTKYINLSSLLVTAGDLVFGGDLEGNAFALDARTGMKLWSFNTGGRIASPPISFSIGNRQFITISSGGGSIGENMVPRLFPESKGHIPEPTSMLFVFALPGEGK